MYAQLQLDGSCNSIIGDVRDREHLASALHEANPDVVFHLAAQPLVLASYDDPVGTLQTNVLGTANLLDAIRTLVKPCTVIVVTSDKCYENRDWTYSYRETDPLGGHDLYSTSKAAAELVATSFRRSFFGDGEAIRVATVRAGNVIGGGDWAAGRIVPDCIRALAANEPIAVRNPRFVRPWQHVLEPLGGYLMLASALLDGRTEYCDAWNFGPRPEDARPVDALVDAVIAAWGSGRWISEHREQPHEAHTLRLCTDKAQALLGWKPRWSFNEGIANTVQWYRAAHENASAEELRALSLAQIEAYQA
jgi:CDP-glucose 4,6-dehydratase